MESQATSIASWSDNLGPVGEAVARSTSECLAAYQAKHNLVEQDAGIEISNVEGGYGRKQLNEMLQNAADAMVARPGRVSIVLTPSTLYCANEGEPLTVAGVEALMASHLSRKRDEQIGRFGLGFKSVLGVSDSPEIFSRSGSVSFDREWAAQEIRTVVPNPPRTPVLRIARPVSYEESARADAVQRELGWATTIVRLPLRPRTSWLSEELAALPAEFLLFSDHVRELTVDDRVRGMRSSWSVAREGDTVVLTDGAEVKIWRVFRRSHQPSAMAIADAGEISGRHTVDLTWAVPDRGRSATGAFWAYFPTNSRTTLSGLVNAAFKTTEDRHDILDGAYNRELLLGVLPSLVAESLNRLVLPADPGSVLDILPARGRESRSWADDALNTPVMRAVAATECVPDMTGRLRAPSTVRLRPPYLIERPAWAALWCSVEGGPSDWNHPSTDSGVERRSKLTRLYEIAGVEAATTTAWLESLAASGTGGSAVAVQLADLVVRGEPDAMVEARKARTVRTADGSLRAPLVGKLFLPDPDEVPTGSNFVSPELLTNPDTEAALRRLGIGPLDATGRLNSLIGATLDDPRGANIERLWILARLVPPDVAARLLGTAFGRGRTPVRSVAGQVATIGSALLPGVVASSADTADAVYVVDMMFHAQDRAVLDQLGAVDGPRLTTRFPDEAWFAEWVEGVTARFLESIRARGMRLASGAVKVRPGKTASHLQLLPHLSSRARVAMTREAVPFCREPWQLYADGRSDVSAQGVPNPGLWWLRTHGMVDTAIGPIPVGEAVGPLPGVDPELLPTPRGLSSDDLRVLGIRDDVNAAWWSAHLTRSATAMPLRSLHQLYAAAARNGCERPRKLLVQDGEHTTEIDSAEVVVAHDERAARVLRDQVDVIVVSEADAQTLRDVWNLGDAGSLLRRRVLAARSGDLIPLLDQFPGLRVTALNVTPDVTLAPCEDLAIEWMSADGAATPPEPVEAVLDGGTFYFTAGRADAAALLRLVDRHLHLGLDDTLRKQTLAIGQRQERNAFTRSVKAAATDEERLLLLAGARDLRNTLPPEAVQIAEKRRGRHLTELEIAGMAAAQSQKELIRKLTPVIEAKGVAVPRALNGGAKATAFVRDLGLPDEFAGTSEGRRAAVEEVYGPVTLPRLHDYQARCVERISRLLDGEGPSRGIVALPTGSGKTRVAVESLVEHLRDTAPNSLIVWIAQSDELCEQAVETWSYVWRAIGTNRTTLTLNRLWTSNDATPVGAGAQVVVATDDKLASLARGDGYEWLRQADIVVVDEAHTSISRTYTLLFNWLGRSTRERSRPLLGLSATPYRNTNVEQTQLLINRYDQNLITDGLFGDEEAHEHLQRIGVLAKVRHHELEGMVLAPLRAAREASEDTTPSSFIDTRVDLEAVARNLDRNTQILDSLRALDPDTTALVFAASVGHADVLASVLTSEGVPAASVSTFTSPGERRERVRQFRDGRIRVLTNYNVLSQGFDAPRVGAVYVARPTFSPNRYQQMIGRGLRGPLNGGSDEVLIVNIRDNIDAFGEQLAFHHFDAMWRAGE